MERKLGEEFDYNGVRFRVETGTHMCNGCYFEGMDCMTLLPIKGECAESMRRDRKGVIFKKLDSEESAKQSILDEAKAIVEGSRQSDYGDPVESFDRIAKTASMITGKDLSPKECCAVLMAVKIVRESFKHKRDNLIDLCGYAHIMNELNENESEKEGE